MISKKHLIIGAIVVILLVIIYLVYQNYIKKPPVTTTTTTTPKTTFVNVVKNVVRAVTNSNPKVGDSIVAAKDGVQGLADDLTPLQTYNQGDYIGVITDDKITYWLIITGSGLKRLVSKNDVNKF